MTDRCPLCGNKPHDHGATYCESMSCRLPVHNRPAVRAKNDEIARLKAECEDWRDAASCAGLQQLKDRIAELEAVLVTIMDNCGCCEDVEPCANCLRAEAALAKSEPRPTPGEEPVTDEWLRATIETSSTRVWALWVAARDFLPNPTRGDVRRLCAALGVELKGE